MKHKKFRPFSPAKPLRERSSKQWHATPTPWNQLPRTDSLRGILWDVPYSGPFKK